MVERRRPLRTSVQYATASVGDGWLVLDRAIDGPVRQGVLAWDGRSWVTREARLHRPIEKSCTLVGARNVERCGLLADS